MSISTYIGNLGKDQRAIYRCLQEHKSWYPGCDWIWGNRSKTIRLLDSLVRRGYVRKEQYTYTGIMGVEMLNTRYTLLEDKPKLAPGVTQEMNDYEIVPNKAERCWDLYYNEDWQSSWDSLAKAENERTRLEVLDEAAYRQSLENK